MACNEARVMDPSFSVDELKSTTNSDYTNYRLSEFSKGYYESPGKICTGPEPGVEMRRRKENLLEQLLPSVLFANHLH